MGMECPKCSFSNTEGSRYCGNCGESLRHLDEIRLSQTETLKIPWKELNRGFIFAGRYKVIEELGRGGMSRVYKVYDKEINEEIALKLLKPEIADDEETIKRFINEVKLSRKISHRNVCRMHDLSKEEETYFITMEYVQGENLKTLITKKGPFAIGRAILIVKQVCEGLAEAHRLGVIHRDLKPQNIMIDRDGNAHIMDFGIARSLKAEGLTETGMIIGTPEYMSPEQVEGEKIDQCSDIYSLGVILYEMVTGRPAFIGNTPLSIALKHKTETPLDPRNFNMRLPDEISQLILRCMEKEKIKRYQRVEELLKELMRIEKDLILTDEIEPEIKFELGSPKKNMLLKIIPFVAVGLIAGYFFFNQILNSGKKIKEERLLDESAQVTQEPSATAAQFGNLEIKSTPSGAEVFIANKREGITPFKSELPPGNYRIKIIKGLEYKEITDVLKIEAGDTFSRNYTLIPTFILNLITTPGNADVRVNGVYIGKSPIILELDQSALQLEIEKGDEWISIDETVALKQGINELKRSLRRAEFSILVSTNPEGALVYIGNELLGNSPVQKLNVHGVCDVRIEKEGYETIKESIHVTSNMEKTYELEKLEIISKKEVTDTKDLISKEKTPKKEIKSEPVKKEKSIIRTIREGLSLPKSPPKKLSSLKVIKFMDAWSFSDSEAGQAFYPTNIIVDRSRHIYVTDQRNRRIYKFMPDSKVVENWISNFTVDNKIIYPYGIAADKSGNIYVCDNNNHRVVKFTQDGNFIRNWGAYGKETGQFDSPTGIAADKSGNIYVCDTNNHRIVKFTQEGKFISMWGKYGKKGGEFRSPTGIAVDNFGFVFVADRYNQRVAKFDIHGTFIDEFHKNYGYDETRRQPMTLIKLKEPVGVAVNDQGFVFVVDVGIHRMVKFSHRGVFATKQGSRGKKPGQFLLPYGIGLDNFGYAYVADRENNRIQVFQIK